MSAPLVGAKAVVKEVLRTKSGLIAFILLIVIASLSLAIPVYAPYDVVKAWNDPRAWLDNPRSAAPEWVDIFTGVKLPRTIVLQEDDFREKSSIIGKVAKRIELRASFDFDYDEFPSDIKITLDMRSKESVKVTANLVRPDGDEVPLLSTVLTIGRPNLVLDSMSEELRKAAKAYVTEMGSELFTREPHVVFFADKGWLLKGVGGSKVLKGRYVLNVDALTFDLEGELDVRLVIYGKAYGPLGTDSMRRDLLVGILWGAPVALAFGIIASVSVTLIQMIFGAISGYFGGKVDEVIQRLTEVMMIIPALPILILVSFVYRPSIWTLLLIIIALGAVGSTTKVVRSMVPPIKEEQYILAAMSYGVGPWRILFKHIIPRVMPYTFSLIALGVPIYIFLEAALSFLGLGDPVLPTWGKILGEAYAGGAAYHGYYWWILTPAFCIGLTAMAFALLGYAFDKLVNPRLREI